MAVCNTRKTVLVIAATCWAATSGMAQESPPLPLLTPFLRTDAPIGVTRGDTLVLTFDQAIARVLQLNPSLREAKSRAGAARGLVRQSKLYPNPEIGWDVEDWGRQSTDGPSQTTISLSQTIPIWGRRGAARREAEQELASAKAEVSATMLHVYRETASGFAELLGAQQNLQNAIERLRVAQEIESVVKTRVNEGAVVISEGVRAEGLTALARVDSLIAESEVRIAQTRLAAKWVDAPANAVIATGQLTSVDSLPPVTTLVRWMADNPALESLRALVAARESQMHLMKSLGLPEPTVGIGYRRLHDAAENAGIASISLPLPLFDRNQGNQQAAAARWEEAKAALESAELALDGQLRELLVELDAVSREIEEIETRVLPSAEEAMQQIDNAYRFGRVPYINVLDAQRTVNELRTRLIALSVQQARTIASIESLVGRPIAENASIDE